MKTFFYLATVSMLAFRCGLQSKPAGCYGTQIVALTTEEFKPIENLRNLYQDLPINNKFKERFTVDSLGNKVVIERVMIIDEKTYDYCDIWLSPNNKVIRYAIQSGNGAQASGYILLGETLPIRYHHSTSCSGGNNCQSVVTISRGLSTVAEINETKEAQEAADMGN